MCRRKNLDVIILLEEEEQEDQFDLTVGITDPEKIGDGMNAYVAYKVTTQTSLPMFRSKQFAVKRRFSDFLGLYEKLSEKHSQNGFIVPPPPEKSLIGMTKVKVGKEDSSSAEFLEKRRAALERYLQRIVNHPTMLQDPDVREFLEKEELPRAVGTQTLSGAGLLKMFNKATDAVSKMTIKMNESDIWFEEKLQEVECEEQRLRKLHAVVEMLVNHRKELALNTAQFAKSLAMLGSSEDNTALSRALSQLAEVEEKIEQLHQEQANSDFFLLAELLSDYIRLLAIVRLCARFFNKAYYRPAVLAPWSSDFLSPLVFASLTVSSGFALAAFDQRMKTWQRWQDAQATLQKKREAEARLLWANKPDKLQQAKDEIVEWESRVTQYERDFERISTVVRKEVIRFENFLLSLLHPEADRAGCPGPVHFCAELADMEVKKANSRNDTCLKPSAFTVVDESIKKLCKVPDFPSKRLPNWRTRGLEQRRQGLEAYIQGILYMNQDVPKELLEFLSLRHFPTDPKASSWSTLGEFLPGNSSSQLYHRPVISFRVDPYICIPSPEPLPSVVVSGVLQGVYGLSASTATAQPEAACPPAPVPPMP
ncbi:sorting nexin-1 isoform 1 [Camelus ferus]|nr:sorting nexin-1 isoform 1 [Camelus ferus]